MYTESLHKKYTIQVFWGVMPWRLSKCCRRFGGLVLDCYTTLLRNVDNYLPAYTA